MSGNDKEKPHVIASTTISPGKRYVTDSIETPLSPVTSPFKQVSYGYKHLTQEELKKVQDCLIESLANHAMISEACDAARIDRSTYYRMLEDDKGFAIRASEARERTVDAVEGKLLHTARTKDDRAGVTAGIFALKNLRPDTYKDRRELDVQGAITFKAVMEQAMLPDIIEGEHRSLNEAETPENEEKTSG